MKHATDVPRNQFVALIGVCRGADSPHNNWLEETDVTKRLRKFCQRIRVELGSRLLWVGNNLWWPHRHKFQSGHCRWQHSRLNARCRRLRRACINDTGTIVTRTVCAIGWDESSKPTPILSPICHYLSPFVEARIAGVRSAANNSFANWRYAVATDESGAKDNTVLPLAGAA